MIKAIKYFWKEQPIALSAFVIAMGFLLFFGSRFVLNFLYFHDPAHRNQALEGWMTPRYVSMSYQVPPEIIRDVMGIEEKGKLRVHLDDVTARLGISLEELQARVWEAKKAHMAEKDARKAARDAERDARRAEEEAKKAADRAKRDAEHAKREAEHAAKEAEREKERIRKGEGKGNP